MVDKGKRQTTWEPESNAIHGIQSLSTDGKPAGCLEDENAHWRGESGSTGPEAGAGWECSNRKKTPGLGHVCIVLK